MENKIAVKKDVYSQVLAKVEQYQRDGELALPIGYNAGNAIKAAQLVLAEVVDRNKKPALEVCTQNSVALALLDMIIQGLNPLKNQCYFIVYGNNLVMQRSRYGEEHLAKSLDPEIEGIYSDVVYKGDVFSYSKKHGRTVVDKHEQKLDNVKDSEIVAAYCTIVYKNGTENTTIMTLDEIYAAWRKSPQRPFDDNGRLKTSSTHGQHPAEMAKKTVVRRACKPIINSSGDSNLMRSSLYRTDDAARDADTDAFIDENNGILDVDINDIEVDETTGEVIEVSTNEAAPY